MIKWFVKKWIKGKINDVLTEKKASVDEIRTNINTWIDRVESITGSLKKISARLDDGNITDDELKDSISDIENVIQTW